MKRIDRIDKDTIKMLNEHSLLTLLVRSELAFETVSTINLEQEEITKAIDFYKLAYNITDEDSFKNWLAKKNMSAEQFPFEIEKKLKFKRYIKNNYDHKVESKFIEEKDSLDQVIYSLIRVKSPDIAKELYLRLSDEKYNFSELAETYSEGNERHTRGKIGPVSLSEGHPKVINLLKTSQPGQINEPFSINGMHLIVRLDEYLPAVLDENMRDKLGLKLFDEWLRAKTITTVECLLREIH